MFNNSVKYCHDSVIVLNIQINCKIYSSDLKLEYSDSHIFVTFEE